ncbi:MAG: homoprotocatechuate degradation operon regulator HpaR [Pseudomonadota bacterium]
MKRFRDIEHSLPIQILKARETTMERFRPMLKKHGLTEQQWRVIRVLAATESLDASELAQRSMLLPPSLTRIAKYLEGIKLVHRYADAQDQRRYIFSLTPMGLEKYQQVGQDSERLYQTIEAEFGEDKLAQLHTLLVELNVALSEKAVQDLEG